MTSRPRVIALIGLAAAFVGLAAGCAQPGRKMDALSPLLSFDPLPPALHAAYLALPGSPDGERHRRQNMINMREDVQNLEGYLSQLEELQRKGKTRKRAKQVKTYRGYLDGARERLESAEQGVPEGRRVARVEVAYRDDDRGNLVVTRNIAWKDGTVETEETAIPKTPSGFVARPMRKVDRAIESPGELLKDKAGRLMPSMAELILKSTAYAEAKAITQDPRFRGLPPAQKKALLSGWKEVEAERSRLLSEARGLDRESKRLYREGVKLEKAAARLRRKCDTLNGDIDLWSRDCAPEDRPCGKRRASLEKRTRGLEEAIGGHNARMARWREAATGLGRRAG